ncbi:SRPBCC domain-containing protein [Oceanicaulis sp.]|uniref:SRPBCC domain-containing protein n=1 Tax=Oceanicaulis sp. TaxID=1924941 RepID=UPI003F6EE8C3
MIAMLAAALLAQSSPELTPFEAQGFRTQIVVEIAAPRDEVFDTATGDVSPWWDHTFWPGPAELVIEPEVGGLFYERFEADAPDGVVHARVIFVQAPEQLRLDGPLGLSGRAVHMVSSWTLEEGDSPHETVFTVDLAMTGEVDEALAGVVRSVWVHFIEGRLKPFMEADCHLEPEAPCAAFESD